MASRACLPSNHVGHVRPHNFPGTPQARPCVILQMEQLCETVDPAKPNFEKLADEIVERLKTARKAFTRAKSPTGIVLNEAALAALEVLEKEGARLTEEAVKDPWEALAGHINPLQEAITQVTLAAKEDLRLFEAEKG